MKKIIAIIFISLSLFCKAQLAPVGTEWYFGIEFESPPGVESNFKYRCEKDTIIENENFSVIQSYNRTDERIYLREDSSMIYYFLDGKKYLYFDFSAKKGDTIQVDILHRVDNISHQIVKTKVLIQDIFYVKNYMSAATDSIRSFTVYLDSFAPWIVSEKLLNMNTDYSFISPDQLPKFDRKYFRCYISDGYTFHSDTRFNTLLSCDYQNVLVNEMRATKSLSIYPNPATNSLFISNKNHDRIKSIAIYNATGKLVYQENITHQKSSHELNISELPSGIYLCHINDENDMVTHKFIKE